jgi:hypothetical protein
MLRKFQPILNVASTLACRRNVPAISSFANIGAFRSFALPRNTKNNTKKVDTSASSKKNEDRILKNEDIRAPTIRVVYHDEENKPALWKILTNVEAQKFAKERGMDLILGM